MNYLASFLMFLAATKKAPLISCSSSLDLVLTASPTIFSMGALEPILPPIGLT